MSIGKTEPMKMTKPAEKSVSPNQTIANGIHASGGIGLIISISGSSSRLTRSNQPIQIPIRNNFV